MIMTFLPQSAWRYAVLIIILFAIVAVASMTIISYLQEQIHVLFRQAGKNVPEHYRLMG